VATLLGVITLIVIMGIIPMLPSILNWLASVVLDVDQVFWLVSMTTSGPKQLLLNGRYCLLPAAGLAKELLPISIVNITSHSQHHLHVLAASSTSASVSFLHPLFPAQHYFKSGT
jgi:hypothetical protein